LVHWQDVKLHRFALKVITDAAAAGIASRCARLEGCPTIGRSDIQNGYVRMIAAVKLEQTECDRVRLHCDHALSELSKSKGVITDVGADVEHRPICDLRFELR
jgi:hypothetical protein